jgi:exosortase
MQRSIKSTAFFALAIFGAVVWAYWPLLRDMARKWATDPQYSQGYVVPLFAAYLIWRRREALSDEACQPTWWGVVLVAVGAAMRLAGTALYFEWLEAFSLLPVLWGAALLLVGWRGLACTWYAIAFLFFMIPLPYRVETGLSHPLQRIATLSSTVTLQTLGLPAFAEGNVIVLNNERIGVIEACNGLGMLMLFFALSVAVAILIKRPLFDKIILVASAVPIAVLVNTIRITATSIIRDKVSAWLADVIFHDLGGWLMMPLALGMLWGVLKLIDLVLITEGYDDEEEEIPPAFEGIFQPR